MGLPDLTAAQAVEELHGLRCLPHLASDHLRVQGWAYLTGPGDGATNVAGAMRACSPVVGDHCFMAGLLDRLDFTAAWESRAGGVEEVIEALRRVEVTPSLMVEAYGRSWPAALYLARQMSLMTELDCRKVATVMSMQSGSREWVSAVADLDSASPTKSTGAVLADARIDYWRRYAFLNVLAGAGISGWETFDWVPHLSRVVGARWRVDAAPFPSWSRDSYDMLCSPWTFALGKKLHPLD